MNFEQMNIDFNLFKTFYMVSQVKVISKAAYFLHLSQPAVSYQIKKLEQTMNTKLFVRSRYGVTLTEKGEILKEKVEVAFHTIVNGCQKMREENMEGEIRIGIPSYIGNYFLTSCIKEFHQKYPNVTFVLFSTTSEDLKAKLENHAIDLVINHYPFTKNEKGIKEEILSELDTCFFIRKEDYSFSKPLSIRDLQRYDLLLPIKNFATSNRLESIFADVGALYEGTYYYYSTEFMIQLVKEGMGIGWTVRASIQKELETGILKEVMIKEKLPRMTFGISYQPSFLRDTTKCLLQMIKEKNK